MANYNSKPDLTSDEGGKPSITFMVHCYIGHGTITRSGDMVTIPLGLKLIPQKTGTSTWIFNSIGGSYGTESGQNIRYAFKGNASNHYTVDTKNPLYCTSRSLSVGQKNTTDETPWKLTTKVDPGQKTVDVKMWASWSQFTLGAAGKNNKWVEVTRSIDIPQPTAPVIGEAIFEATGRDTASYSCVISSPGDYSTISSYTWTVTATNLAATYDSQDLYKVRQHILGNTLISNDEFYKYDFTGDGKIDDEDLEHLRRALAGYQETSDSGTIDYLAPNTTYNWTLTVTNSNDLSATTSGSFTTSGNYPTIKSVTASSDRTSIVVRPTVIYDYNDSFASYNFSYGTSSSSLSRGPSTAIAQNLQPNTTYYYRISVISTQGKQSTYQSGQITTTCNAPTNPVILRKGGDTTSLVIEVGATGDTNAPIKNYILKYTDPDKNTSTITMGSATVTTIPGLLPDTNYTFQLTAINDGGSITSNGNTTYSTTLTNPTITKIESSNILPFSCTIIAEASINPERDLKYAFSKDGQDWTPYQDSDTYNWSGLSEETTYTMYVRAKATHLGINASDTIATRSIIVATPADQAKVRIYQNKTWKKGKLWFKNKGQWKKAKKVYIKKDGKWVVGYNYEN